MQKIYELVDKINSSITELGLKLNSELEKKNNLIKANQNLEHQNTELRKECHNALHEIEKCLKTIDQIETHGNNNS